ncbi:dentin sialophosphoprotein-like isoform X1 [Phoenix dactylifera]|uniref:Dentin sialophosphoprotein-like isoform X1 n=1 Tax=Phoenix dactylifera TaxID=42345 RepID=A0A8B7CSL9_PHODC|nr:dentin sialophosphoprotein-like isoform X1 [Phoenix dactylifera]
MAYEIPFDLIHRLQSGLRTAAGVPSYNPTDPALPPLASIDDAVAELDTTLPPYLRCKRCRGGLLRGLQSTLCIYCGADRGKEGFSYEISFNSTVGCRKLLESLGLDGSEPVTLETESSDPKGKDTPMGGLVLSDLLDLELKWPLDKEEVDNSSTNNKSPTNAFALKLSGVDLDNFFSEPKIEAASAAPSIPNEQMMPSKQSMKTEIHDFSGSDSMFENLRSSDMKASSFNNKSGEFGDSFTVWEAEFQSANSNTSDSDSKSVDLFQGLSNTKFVTAPRPEVTINWQTDVQNEICSKGNTGKSTYDAGQPSSSNTWIPDDFWPMKTGEVSKSDQFKSKDETNIDELNNNSNYMPDHEVQDDLWPPSSTKESDNTKSINDNDDSIDDWQDFTGWGKAQESSSNLGIQTEPKLSELPSETKSVDLLSPSSTKESGNSKNLDGKNDLFDDWQGFTSLGLSTSGSQARATLVEHPSETKSADLWFTSSTRESDNNENLDGNDDSFDDWQDFTTTGEAVGSLSNLRAQTGATLFEHSSETNSLDLGPMSSTKESDKTENMDGNDNLFDDWQGFASSGNAQGSLSNSGAQTGATLLDHPSETKSVDLQSTKESDKTKAVNGNDDPLDDGQGLISLGETTGSLLSSRAQTGDTLHAYPSNTRLADLQGMEFGSFLHSYSFSQTPGSQNVSSEGNNMPLDVSISNRMSAMHETFGVDSHSSVQGATDINKNSTAALTPESANFKVEELLSQMHDLSFMLEDNLSIPEKTERSDSNS